MWTSWRTHVTPLTSTPDMMQADMMQADTSHAGTKHAQTSHVDTTHEARTTSLGLGNCRLELGQEQAVGTRDEQQDRCAVHLEEDGERSGALLVVADGMGGHQGGAQASVVATEAFVASFRARDARLPIGPALALALNEANRAVLEAREREGLDMGTTLCALWLDARGTFHFISVGDSPMFICRDGAITRLNCDHTLRRHLQGALARGRITLEELARRASEFRYLTSHLGLEPLPEIDLSDQPQPWFAGDHFVLCSDGLTGAMTRKAIALRTTRHRGQELAESLVAGALERGHRRQDNITAVTACLTRPATGADSAPSDSAPGETASADDEIVSGLELALGEERSAAPARPSRAPLWALLAGSLVLNLVLLAALWWR